jgi:hypothetical protein
LSDIFANGGTRDDEDITTEAERQRKEKRKNQHIEGKRYPRGSYADARQFNVHIVRAAGDGVEGYVRLTAPKVATTMNSPG